MRANPNFTDQPASFWALVRTLSEKLGYTHRVKKGETPGSGALKIHTSKDMALGLTKLGLDPELVHKGGEPTLLGQRLSDYFEYRARVLHDHAEKHLMNLKQARELFHTHHTRLTPSCPLPNNKQKKEKAGPAYFTCLINMLLHEVLGALPCDYDPKHLTTFTRNRTPLRTLSRRVDGAFPATVNPIAIWEVKEYYFTKTFGSRVADGVYETLLDGTELKELHDSENVRADHVLFIDDHFTWWICGKSYLCRMIDMLHMGQVSEVVFGREVVERVPALARDWMKVYEKERQEGLRDIPAAQPAQRRKLTR